MLWIVDFQFVNLLLWIVNVNMTISTACELYYAIYMMHVTFVMINKY